jgi:shikimate dehydrogenase
VIGNIVLTTNISGTTQIVGVWGYPVGHSRSPVMQNAALKALGLNWVYVPFEVAPENVGAAVAAIRALGLVGVNVTVPLKELVLPYLDEVDEAAVRIGSVNTIHNQNGRLVGYSTDGTGFLRSLADAGQSGAGQTALILGAGGSARAVAFALAEQGTVCLIVNRTQSRAEALAVDINYWFPQKAFSADMNTEFGPLDLIVNTTSAGMHPNEDSLPPLPPNVFESKPFVYDLIYAPPRTGLLALAADAGCRTVNGLGMLAHQGALALAIWTGRPAEEMPVAVMAEAIRESV